MGEQRIEVPVLAAAMPCNTIPQHVDVLGNEHIFVPAHGPKRIAHDCSKCLIVAVYANHVYRYLGLIGYGRCCPLMLGLPASWQILLQSSLPWLKFHDWGFLLR